MDNVVVILGAGASAPFGVPTLLRVFQDPYARQYLKTNPWLHEKLLDTFWAPRGHTLERSHLGLSVEEVLTVVRDHEKRTYGVAPLFDDDDAQRFRRDLYVLIKKAIYDGKHSRGKYLNPLIQCMHSQAKRVTWASFNWDCIFEASYYYSSGSYPHERSNPWVVVDLRNWRNTLWKSTFLKLHGGVNWWFEDGKLIYLPFGSQTDLNTKWLQYEHGEAKGSPVILEPSYYKYQDPVYDHLKSQWEYFVKRLLDADLVVILGYSLPEADIEARRALTIGFQGNPKARFIVVDNTEWICGRYERLFGSERLVTIRQDIKDIGQQLPELIGQHAGFKT